MYAFKNLEANYAALAARAVIVPDRERELQLACERLLRDKEAWLLAEAAAEVPAAALMALGEREMSGNTRCYLGNGQSLKMRTTIVPKNRGPFEQPYPQDFVAGCVDSIGLDGIAKLIKDNGGKLTIPLFCYISEDWNGWGYRHPPDGGPAIPSPYVFGATTIQKPGKFPRDHVFVRSMMDPQLGTLAIVEELVKQDPSLSFADGIPKVESPSTAPITIQAHPALVNANAMWIQQSLNKLKVAGTPLLVDGNIGRATRAVVRTFEQRNRLLVDRGIPGPQVVAKIKQSLAENGMG
jgi:lysozyme family protein